MEIIANTKEVYDYIIFYTTIIDEHVMLNLLTIFGKEKSVAIILEGKKYDNKFHIIKRYKNLICDLDFHPDKGLIMKSYDFSSPQIKSIKTIKAFLKNAGLAKYEFEIESIIANSSANRDIKIVGAEDYFLEKLNA